MEDIIDADYTDVILMSKVIHYCEPMYVSWYIRIDLAHFLSTPGLALQRVLKKTKVKLYLLTDIDILLIVEKGIRGVIYHAIHWCVEADNKYMQDHDKNKESLYLKYWDVNNLYGWAISQRLPVDSFKCVENISQFNKDLLQNCNEDSDAGHFFEISKNYMTFTIIFHFYLN